jgi:TRAP-type C4-dicarboxylate transport system substrate-binding protein
MRHISNRLRPLNMPGDLAGMKIRVLPSEIQARTFALLGAEPVKCDLTEAIAWIKEGRLDAQENPLANTVTYGVHKFHRFHTLTNHFYISRPIFVHRESFDAWPADVQQAMREAVREAVTFQRGETVKEHEESLAAIKAEGCEVAELPPAGHDAFVKAVRPLYEEARKAYGPEPFKLLPPV